MVRVDITCDLMDEDETGHVWAFLHDARDPAPHEPGAIVVVGDADAPAVAEVVDIVDKSADRVVHLHILLLACLRITRRSSGERSYRPELCR